MQLTNTTRCPRIPDDAIRKATRFCCTELGIQATEIKELIVRNRADGGTSGRIWLRQGKIVISVGFILANQPSEPSERDEWGCFRLGNDDALRKRIDKMMGVLTHEVAHRAMFLQGKAKGPRSKRPGECEKTVQWHANLVMAHYREQRAELLERWLAARPRNERAVADKRAVRAKRDAELLRAWERKLALARTKVTKYKRKVARATADGLLS